MRRVTTIVVIIVSTFVVALTVAQAAVDKTREQALQQAIDLIESRGDLAKATPLLEEVAKSPDRALAARGLFQLAQAQERFGKSEALTTYTRITSEFGGAAEPPAVIAIVEVARKNAAALAQRAAGLTVRRVWDDEADSVSPDGRYLTYTDWNTGDLALHELPGGQNRLLTTNRKWNEDFGEGGLPSPDSRLIAYSWYDHVKGYATLRVISRDGGQSRVVYANEEKADTVWPVGWSSDGKWILATIDKLLPTPRTPRLRDRDVKLISTTGAASRLIRHFEKFPDFQMNPSLSPDGRWIAYNWRPTPGMARDVYVMSTETGREMPLIQHPSDDDVLGWMPTGDCILFASDRGSTYGIWAARVVDAALQGEPLLIRPATGQIVSNGVTRQGELYYRATTRDFDVYVANVDGGSATARPGRLESRFIGGKAQAAWSPDGSRLVYVKEYTSSDPVPTLAIHTMATGMAKLIPLPLQNLNGPVWMPDGRSVIVQGRDAEGRQGLHMVNVESGALTSIAVRQSGNDIRRGSAAPTPDGRRIFLAWSSPTDAAVGGIAARDLASGDEQKLTTTPVAKLVLSPDGRWLGATPMGDGDRLLLYSSSGGEKKPLPPAVKSWSIGDIAWSSDSRSMLVVKGSPRMMEVWRVPVDGGEPQPTGITWPGGGINRISVHPDGRRLALSISGASVETWVLQNLPAMRDK